MNNGGATAGRALLEARALTVRLGRRIVLDGIDLALGAGSLCALAGPNGAGKSTLLRALAGTVPLVSGGGRHAGMPAPLAHRAVARHIAYLPQDRTVHWDLSVARVVALGRMPHVAGNSGLSATDHAAIDRAMVRMDIGHLAHRPIREVSGGERARVLIARALAQETPVLLADEPVAGLDPAHQLALFAHLRALASDGRAVVVALHDLSLAVRFADRVILMHQGRIAADGPPVMALSRDNIARVFGIDSRLADVWGVPVVVPLGPCRPDAGLLRAMTYGGPDGDS